MENLNYRRAATTALTLLIVACSHPIEIVGDGDVFSATGSRDCSLQDYTAGREKCALNLVYGEYHETYFAVAHSGWMFDKWLNYCLEDTLGECSFSIPAHIVEQASGSQVPPLVAVFKRSSGFEQPTTPDPPANSTQSETPPTPPAAKPGPAPKPEPAPKPVAAPEPEPAPKPVVAPKPEPAPKPVAAPKPAPAPKPVAAPKPEPAPKPVVAPKPEPAPKPVAAPEPEPAPKPVAAPTPEPAPKPAPAPEPAPKPAPAPKPVAAPTPAPETLIEPAPAPTAVVAPKPVTVKTQTAIATRTVKLRWTAPSNRENGAALSTQELNRFEIIASPVDGGQSLIFVISDSKKNSYTIEGLAQGAYEFRIIAVDNQGLSSKPSASVVVD